MRSFLPHRHEVLELTTDEPAPWTDGHASPEDRALGFELELIELERRRREVSHEGGDLAPLEAEMAQVRAELAAVTGMIDLRSVA
jgi:hypothetical protein